MSSPSIPADAWRKGAVAFMHKRIGHGWTNEWLMADGGIYKADDYGFSAPTVITRPSSAEAELRAEIERLRDGYECNTAMLHARTAKLNACIDERDQLRAKLAMAEDAAAKGDLARLTAGGMELEIAELRAELSRLRDESLVVRQRDAMMDDRNRYRDECERLHKCLEALHELKNAELEKARTPEGWKLVPIELDMNMLSACQSVVDLEIGDPEHHEYDEGTETAQQMWTAILAAAPSPKDSSHGTD